MRDPQPLQEALLPGELDGANTHTDGNGDLLTNSARWGRVGENPQLGTDPTHNDLR